MSDFYVTDICTSDLCGFFIFSNRRPMTSLTNALILTNKTAIDLRIGKDADLRIALNLTDLR